MADLAGADPSPYWLSQDGAPAPADPLAEAETADLAVIGAGFSGLWTALLAKERDPGIGSSGSPRRQAACACTH